MQFTVRFALVIMTLVAMLGWIIVQDMRTEKVRDLLLRRGHVNYHHQSLGKVVIYLGRTNEMYHSSQNGVDRLAIVQTDLAVDNLSADEIEFLRQFLGE